MRSPRNERALVRPHVVTGGRSRPTRTIFDLVTLVTAAAADRPTGLGPERRRIVQLCQGGALSVAEVAGHLGLPVSVTRVLLSDLVDSGHITTWTQNTPAGAARVRLLERVLDGLRTAL